MKKEVVIQVENLSKQYRLGVVGTGTISHDLNRLWARLRGKEDPNLLIGESNDRTKVGDSDLVWALKDINFEVERGDILGIIGKNGAGKSTLLKVLSQVTGPTGGKINMKGRVGALLEVGTGFHEELTGRENVYINGAILGMRKTEITTKMKDIIEFAGVEKYIDTPVKRYSSGMKVRLGFSVAAHLDPEILIVDEVLAVGDAEFQKKCLGKMDEISKQGGRTILFVSHNMTSIRNLCHSCIVLENGMPSFQGGVEEAIQLYLGDGEKKSSSLFEFDRDHKKPIQFTKIEVRDFEGNLTNKIEFKDHGYLHFELSKDFELANKCILNLTFLDSVGNEAFVLTSNDSEESPLQGFKGERVNTTVRLPKEVLKPGTYFVTPSLYYFGKGSVDVHFHLIVLEVIDTYTYRGISGRYSNGSVLAPSSEWTYEVLNK